MAANNSIVLIGRSGNTVADDVKTLNSGDKVATVRLAVNRPTKDAQGNNQTDWVNCEAWGKNAERLAEFVQKGDLISVSGALRIETWEKDGNKQSKTLVRIENFQMLESRASREQRTGAPAGNNYGSQESRQPASVGASKKGQPTLDLDDDGDELPPF